MSTHTTSKDAQTCRLALSTGMTTKRPITPSGYGEKALHNGIFIAHRTRLLQRDFTITTSSLMNGSLAIETSKRFSNCPKKSSNSRVAAMLHSLGNSDGCFCNVEIFMLYGAANVPVRVMLFDTMRPSFETKKILTK